MSGPIARRRVLRGLTAMTTLALAGCRTDRYLPPRIGDLIDASNALSMASQRLLLRNRPLAREFGSEDISARFPAINTVNPEDSGYQALLKGGFRDWRLPVEGMVKRPLSLSLADLKQFPSRTQITAHSCERGWTAIAQWTGAPLGRVLETAGMHPDARYVVFDTVDGWYDSLDMFDALHPQTILTYGMNGADLPVRHGAPLRLRAEMHLGYRQLKYLRSIRVVDSVARIAEGCGGSEADAGWSWYAGI